MGKKQKIEGRGRTRREYRTRNAEVMTDDRGQKTPDERLIGFDGLGDFR